MRCMIEESAPWESVDCDPFGDAPLEIPGQDSLYVYVCRRRPSEASILSKKRAFSDARGGIKFRRAPYYSGSRGGCAARSRGPARRRRTVS
jgi:hypothetical protein